MRSIQALLTIVGFWRECVGCIELGGLGWASLILACASLATLARLWIGHCNGDASILLPSRRRLVLPSPKGIQRIVGEHRRS